MVSQRRRPQHHLDDTPVVYGPPHNSGMVESSRRMGMAHCVRDRRPQSRTEDGDSGS